MLSREPGHTKTARGVRRGSRMRERGGGVREAGVERRNGSMRGEDAFARRTKKNEERERERERNLKHLC